MNTPTLPPAPPAGAHAVTLPCGTALQLLPQRAVWWPAARMVLVADVHFGKAATFRRAGLPVPHGTADNLARLDAVLTATGADHLVFLGDFLHARGGAADALWQQLLPWRQRHARVAMTLVRGNGDLHAGDPPALFAMALVHEPWQPCATVPVLACHHPQAVAGHTVIAKHLHPTLRLRGPGRDTMRTPCFGWGKGFGLVLARLRGLPVHGARHPACALGVKPRCCRAAGGCSRDDFIGSAGGGARAPRRSNCRGPQGDYSPIW
ncbi:MAG: ligase-associated DNA damage response endonuclease PdeM [Paenacidovorax caeni]